MGGGVGGREEGGSREQGLGMGGQHRAQCWQVGEVFLGGGPEGEAAEGGGGAGAGLQERLGAWAECEQVGGGQGRWR